MGVQECLVGVEVFSGSGSVQEWEFKSGSSGVGTETVAVSPSSCSQKSNWKNVIFVFVFLAVHNSSIGDLVTD